MDGGAGLTLLLETITRTGGKARAAGGEPAAHADALATAAARIGEVTTTLWTAGDPAVALFAGGKRAAARYFFRYELPRTGPQFALRADLDRTTLDVRPEWF